MQEFRNSWYNYGTTYSEVINLDLEFLTVGVARGNVSDLRSLYDQTHNEVFALAVSIVKDVGLAGDVTAEVYRRVRALAYLFNSDMSAEYWLLDMAKNIANNVSHNPAYAGKISNPRQYNLSSLLLELVNKGKNDRASIVMLFTMSGLSSRDIARILWYKTGSAKNEARRGIARLNDKFTEKPPAQIKEEIARDVEAASPDVWNRVIQEEETVLSSVSHEELGLDSDTLVYTEEDAANAIEAKHIQEKKRSRKIKIAVIAVAAIILLNIGALLMYNVLKKDKEDALDPGVQYGNRMAICQIGDKIYFQNIKKDNKLFVYDLKTGSSSVFVDVPVKEVVTDGTQIFYRNYTDGKTYSITPDSGEPKILTDTDASCLTYHDGKIYFSDKHGISSVNTDGTDEKLYADISEESADYVYYESQNVLLFRYLMKFDKNGVLYFSAGAGKGIYFIADFGDTLGVESVYLGEAYTFDFYKNEIYFDCKTTDFNGNSTISLCKLDENGQTVAVKGFELGTGAYFFDGDILYFDGAVGKETGIFRVNMADSSAVPEKVSDLRASEIYVTGSNLFAYYPGDTESPKSYFKSVDLAQKKEVSVF